jgi:hypothetical protein
MLIWPRLCVARLLRINRCLRSWRIAGTFWNASWKFCGRARCWCLVASRCGLIWDCLRSAGKLRRWLRFLFGMARVMSCREICRGFLRLIILASRILLLASLRMRCCLRFCVTCEHFWHDDVLPRIISTLARANFASPTNRRKTRRRNLRTKRRGRGRGAREFPGRLALLRRLPRAR